MSHSSPAPAPTKPADAKPAAPAAAAPAAAPAPAAGGHGHGAAGGSAFLNFVNGGLASCIATACVQPIDMVKVRLQLSGELGKGVVVKNPFTMAGMIIKNEGVMTLYKGLSAALARQIIYGSIRLGAFRTISDKLKVDGKITPLKSVFAGLSAGAMAAFCGNPTDIALVRMQADSTLPPELRRHYRNVFHALWRMLRDEGVVACWRGAGPAMARAMSLTAGQLTTYDLAKEFTTKQLGKGFTANLCAAFISGFFASVASLPFDFVRTRVQKQRAGKDGKLPYSGTLDCCFKVAKTEGIMAFYKGFPAYYMRIAPISLILLLSLEAIQKYERQFGILK